MKKIIAMAMTAVMAAFCYSDTVTNAVDVYDVTAKVRTPVVKLAKATKNTAAYVYRDVESRTLKGTLTLTWVKEDGDDFEDVIPALSLYDKGYGTDSTVDYKIVDEDETTRGVTPFDFSILGKKMEKSAAIFVGVDETVDESNAGYKFLEFSGFGTTATVKTKTIIPGCCGFTSTGTSVCKKINTLSGKVTGMYSTGCDADSPSAAAQSCGFIDDGTGATPLVACDGTWAAKWNKKLSH
jgi:hypothetical protein